MMREICSGDNKNPFSSLDCVYRCRKIEILFPHRKPAFYNSSHISCDNNNDL